MNAKHRNIAVLIAVALALVWCVPAVGQVLKGSISGTVVDPQGAVVSGAQVKATKVDTGEVFTTTSDSSGLFRLNLIPSGTYKVEIGGQNFKTTVQNNVDVGAGVDQGLGLVKLSVGSASETLEVTAAAPLIESTQAQVTNTFSGTTLHTFAGIQENEGMDNLALFVPGVSKSRSDNFSNTNGVGFSVDGLRGRSNDQQIDGQNNNDNSVGGPGLFLSDPNFVDQYVIITNNFGPEYGRDSGSVVNIITKSGTNNWHGSIYGDENNSFLNAMTATQKSFSKDAAGNPLTGPPRSNEEFSGLTVGGPIVKNKAFLFSGFNTDIFSGSTIYDSGTEAPTPAGLATLASCFPGNQNVAALTNFGAFAVSAGNPIALKPTTTLVPGCGTPVQLSTIQRVFGTPAHEYDWVMKSDLNFANDSVTARYLFNRNDTFNTSSSGTNSAAAGYINNVPALSQSTLLSWTHNFSPRMVNEGRAAFGRLNVEFGGNNLGTVSPAGDLTEAITNVTFQSASLLGFGPATNIPQSRLVNTWQLQDNWNDVVGKHNFKAGVNWTYQRSPNIFLPDINGQFRFGPQAGGCGGLCTANTIGDNLLSFIDNQPNRVSIAEGDTTLDFREYDTFLYGGDDWKIAQNLTLNLGLTWSYYGQPANLFNQITQGRESNPSTAFFASTDRFGNPIPVGDRIFPSLSSPKNSFGPSVGFAYSPQWGGFLTGHGKTTFRGGYRMLYDPPFYNIYLNISSSAPVSFLDTFTNAAAAPKGIPVVPTGPNVRASLSSFIQNGVFDPRNFAETTIPSNFGPDRVQEWSFGFEREVTKNSAFEVRYVGNYGGDLFQSVNANPFIGALAASFPSLVPAGLTPCPAAQAVVPVDVGRVNCDGSVLRSRENTGYSYYNGLQTEFRATNLFRQLTMIASYTWAKTTDNTSEIFSTDAPGNTSAFAQNPLNFTSGEYGISGLNFPQNFTVTFNEQLPFFREQHGAAGHLLGGWSFSGTYIFASGQPYTPSQIAEATATGGDFYDNTFNGTFNGFETARPFLGSSSAPVNTVGMFCGDAITLLGVTSAQCTAAGGVNQLISVNSFNSSHTVLAVTNQQVRFIENTGIAQKMFGTPFGNVGRNSVTDAPANVANLTVAKRFKIAERASFEMHATALNVFNHFNFSSVDPFILDAGLSANGTGFGVPSLTSTLATQDGFRKLLVGGVLTF